MEIAEIPAPWWTVNTNAGIVSKESDKYLDIFIFIKSTKPILLLL